MWGWLDDLNYIWVGIALLFLIIFGGGCSYLEKEVYQNNTALLTRVLNDHEVRLYKLELENNEQIRSKKIQADKK